jgi:hypothetical protein
MARMIKAELAGALAARADGLHHRLGIESVATAITSVLLDGATACQEPGKGKMKLRQRSPGRDVKIFPGTAIEGMSYGRGRTAFRRFGRH